MYNYTSNYIGGHGYDSDHQKVPSGQALVLFDVFGFILSNLQVILRYPSGKPSCAREITCKLLARRRSYV